MSSPFQFWLDQSQLSTMWPFRAIHVSSYICLPEAPVSCITVIRSYYIKWPSGPSSPVDMPFWSFRFCFCPIDSGSQKFCPFSPYRCHRVLDPNLYRLQTTSDFPFVIGVVPWLSRNDCFGAFCFTNELICPYFLKYGRFGPYGSLFTSFLYVRCTGHNVNLLYYGQLVQ